MNEIKVGFSHSAAAGCCFCCHRRCRCVALVEWGGGGGRPRGRTKWNLRTVRILLLRSSSDVLYRYCISPRYSLHKEPRCETGESVRLMMANFVGFARSFTADCHRSLAELWVWGCWVSRDWSEQQRESCIASILSSLLNREHACLPATQWVSRRGFRTELTIKINREDFWSDLC